MTPDQDMARLPFAPAPEALCSGGLGPQWAELAARFALQPLDLDLILLALAPEIDRKYETLYSYLNNDVTRKTPTCELALRLFTREGIERIGLRRFLQREATLFREGLFLPTPSTPDRPYFLSSGFTLSP